VRVSSACTRGTLLYPDCRPPTSPTFRPRLRHTPRVHVRHTWHRRPSRARSVHNTCVRATVVFGRRRRRRARAGRSEKRILWYARGVPPPTTFFARTVGEKRARARARARREREKTRRRDSRERRVDPPPPARHRWGARGRGRSGAGEVRKTEIERERETSRARAIRRRRLLFLLRIPRRRQNRSLYISGRVTRTLSISCRNTRCGRENYVCDNMTD